MQTNDNDQSERDATTPTAPGSPTLGDGGRIGVPPAWDVFAWDASAWDGQRPTDPGKE